MVSLDKLVQFLNELLDIEAFPGDKSNNGLQIEGKSTVGTVVGGVDACAELYREAAKVSADIIIVHHGESWGDGIKTFTGYLAERFRLLFENSLSLYAAHLPLDAHPKLGHNARIAACLELTNVRPFALYMGIHVGVFGQLQSPLSAAALSSRIDAVLDTRSSIYDFHGRELRSIGVVSGCGVGAIDDCRKMGIDCLVTGEFDHASYHHAKELGLCVIAAGHYKTEVPGIIMVLDTIRDQFKIDCQFIDIPTGI